MTKRRISRRALGVVVGASLLVLGLEAPAFAVPAISAISPTSGPDDCVVVITGTGFLESPEAQTDVDFVTGAGPTVVELDSSVISDTEIWAVPEAAAVLVPGTSYNVRITTPTTPAAGVTSTATYLATSGAGACAPTIASFTPTCASAGDTVVITGTNLIEADLTGGDVFFSPYDTATPPSAEATHTVPDIDTPTSLSVIVPSTTSTATVSGTRDGPIKVTTDVGSVFSATSFLVPPPDCTAGPVTHDRSISLSLKKHLIAKGAVTVADDTAECMAGVPVKIQRRKKGGGWKNVGSTTTTDAGKYKRAIKDKPGKYRALAPKVTLADDSVCSKDVSPRVRHTH